MIVLDPSRSVALLLFSLAVPTEVKDVSDESKFFRADKLLEVLRLEPLTKGCTVALLIFAGRHGRKAEGRRLDGSSAR